MRNISQYIPMRLGMKKRTIGSCLRVAIGSLFFLACANTTQAKGFLFFSWGTEVCQVHELPKDYMIETSEYGKIHVNIGVIYDEFSIFWIPTWNWNVDTYVLLPDNYDTLNKGNYVFYNIDKEELSKIRQMVGDLPEKPELSFWRSIGGKLITFPVILYFLFLLLSPSKNDKENNVQEEASEAEPSNDSIDKIMKDLQSGANLQNDETKKPFRKTDIKTIDKGKNPSTMSCYERLFYEALEGNKDSFKELRFYAGSGNAEGQYYFALYYAETTHNDLDRNYIYWMEKAMKNGDKTGYIK